MTLESKTQFIESLALAALPVRRTQRSGLVPPEAPATKPIMDDKISGYITGGDMVAFPKDFPVGDRGAVTLSLLLAQEAAKGNTTVTSPDSWMEQHDKVLLKLGWAASAGADQDQTYTQNNLSVNETIIPLLAAALGPAAAATTLIVLALKQLQAIDKDKPWITLFNRESRRFEHNEYSFVAAEMAGSSISLRIVALRLEAQVDRIQVLFFSKEHAGLKFTIASRTLIADAKLLETLRAPLEKKLQDRANQLIEAIDLPAFS